MRKRRAIGGYYISTEKEKPGNPYRTRHDDKMQPYHWIALIAILFFTIMAIIR